MKIIKTIITTLLFALLVVGMTNYAQAQQRQRPPQGQGDRQRPQIDTKKVLEEQMKWFKANFDLTDNQTKKIEEIHKVSAEQRKTVMESGLNPRDTGFQEKMEGIDITKDAEIQEVLTEEQWTSFEQKKEEYMTIGKPERPQRQRRNR